MSLDVYQGMQQSALQDNTYFGTTLPALSLTSINIESSEVSARELSEQVEQLTCSSSWCLYRDMLVINPHSIERTDLIEGEFTNGQITIKATLLGNDRFRIVRFTPGATAQSKEYAVKTMAMSLNKRAHEQLNSADTRVADYAVLYALDTEAEGRWRPVTQQFLGFNPATESN